MADEFYEMYLSRETTLNFVNVFHDEALQKVFKNLKYTSQH